MSSELDHDVDLAPGEGNFSDAMHAIQTYLVGFVFAVILTGLSFYTVYSPSIWKPSIPVALIILAIAQMGVHIVFFLHITTGPDSTNNILALAFGVLIVTLIIGGSLWIMANMNANMMPLM